MTSQGRSLSCPAGTPSSTRNIGANVATNGNAEVEFNIPEDYVTLVSAGMIIIPGNTLGAADVDLYTDYAQTGEDAQMHSESDTTATYSWTANELFEIDISSVLTSVTSGDKVGIQLDNNSVAGGYLILGVRLRWSTV